MVLNHVNSSFFMNSTLKTYSRNIHAIRVQKVQDLLIITNSPLCFQNAKSLTAELSDFHKKAVSVMRCAIW